MNSTTYCGYTIHFRRAYTGEWYYTFRPAGPPPPAAEAARFGPFPTRLSAEQDVRWRVDVLTADWRKSRQLTDAASATAP